MTNIFSFCTDSLIVCKMRTEICALGMLPRVARMSKRVRLGMIRKTRVAFLGVSSVLSWVATCVLTGSVSSCVMISTPMESTVGMSAMWDVSRRVVKFFPLVH